MSNRQGSKSIKIEQKNIIYALNLGEQTAQIVGSKSVDNFFIPHCIEHKNQKYVITRICNYAFHNSTKIRSIQFAADSELQIIEKNAFSNSSIESISIPASLVALEDGWCNNTPNLNRITVIPSNPYYKSQDDQILLKKSIPEKENYDVLIFSIHTLETITVPDFVEVIASNSFSECLKLKQIDFSSNSKIRVIEKNAFYGSSIESISIPSSLVELKEGWSINTPNLTNITVMPNNPYFKLHDDQILLKKSNIQNENYDILSFARRDIKTAIIPDSIEIIDSYSFENCRTLERIEFSPNSKLQRIGQRAFSHCSIPSISIPSSVTLIDELAFYYCDQLQQINFASNSKLQTIGKSAFFGSKIKSISIPSSLVELKEGWCSGMLDLTNIAVMPNNPYFKLHDDQILLKKSNIQNENYDILSFARRDIKAAIIPDSIEIIDSYSFENCGSLERIEFSPNSKLQRIGQRAFSNCSIPSISIPSSVTEIGESSFSFCKLLHDFIISNNSELQIIEKDAFSCSSIQSIFIPRHVTKIGKGAFYSCNGLANVSFQENSELHIIEEDAFSYCVKLGQIPIETINQLQKIGKSSFSYSSLKNISIPSSVVEIDEYAFYYCKELCQISFPNDSNLQKIGKSAFENSSIESILIPSSVTQIDEKAFYACYRIKKLEVSPNSKLETFEENILSNSSIESVSIPSSLVELKEGWGINTPNLTNITVMPNNPYFKLHDDQFLLKKSNIQNENYDILSFARRDIKTATIPDSIEIIDSYSFENCGSLERIEFSPNSKLRQISYRSFSHSSIVYISIPPSVNRIDERAFACCNKLQHCQIPSNSQLQVIGKYAFYYCLIDSILIPSSLVHICESAFYHCNDLHQIEIQPNSALQIIDKNAFYRCSFENISIPSSLIKISEGSFKGCRPLYHLNVPNDSQLQTIENDAFEENTFESLIIPTTLINLKEGWCNDTPNLTKITVMPNNPYFKLHEDQFLLKKSNIQKENYDILSFAKRDIKAAIIPDSIEIIESYSFENCRSLERI